MPVCPKPLTSRSIAATHKKRLKWTTSYGSKSVQPEGRRSWGQNDRGEKTGEEALCLAGEAWDSEWQENTETVGRAVGRSQLFLCVCKGLSGHSSTRPRNTGQFKYLWLYLCVQAWLLLVGRRLLNLFFVPLSSIIKWKLYSCGHIKPLPLNALLLLRYMNYELESQTNIIRHHRLSSYRHISPFLTTPHCIVTGLLHWYSIISHVNQESSTHWQQHNKPG